MKVAAIQMVSGASLQANLDSARALLEQAAQAGAQLAVLPEYFCLHGSARHRQAGAARELRRRPGAALPGAGRARAAGSGSSAAPCRWPPATTPTCATRSLVFSPAGECVARYDKIHLFKFDNGRERYDETRVIEGGREPVAFELPLARRAALAHRPERVLRPALSGAVSRAGAPDVLLVPSAFTYVHRRRRTGNCCCAPARSRTWPT